MSSHGNQSSKYESLPSARTSVNPCIQSIPLFIETVYLKAATDHIKKKLMPDFLKSFRTPEEFDWKNFVDMVRAR